MHTGENDEKSTYLYPRTSDPTWHVRGDLHSNAVYGRYDRPGSSMIEVGMNKQDLVEHIARMGQHQRNEFVTHLVSRWPNLAMEIADSINFYTIDEDEISERMAV